MTDTYTSFASVTPVVTAGAYIADDAVGGLLTFEAAMRNVKGTGVLLSVTIQDNASQDAALDLVLFSKTFTATADNAAFDPTDADLANCLGHVSISGTDYATFNDNSIATVKNIGLAVRTVDVPGANAVDGALYGQLVTRGTPTYVAVTDVTVTVGTLQD